MEFTSQEYWTGLSFPPKGNLPNSEIKPRSPSLQADSLSSEPPGKPHTLPTLFNFTYIFLLSYIFMKDIFTRGPQGLNLSRRPLDI